MILTNEATLKMGIELYKARKNIISEDYNWFHNNMQELENDSTEENDLLHAEICEIADSLAEQRKELIAERQFLKTLLTFTGGKNE